MDQSQITWTCLTAQSDQIQIGLEAAAALAVFLYALLAKLRVRTSPDAERVLGISWNAVRMSELWGPRV